MKNYRTHFLFSILFFTVFSIVFQSCGEKLPEYVAVEYDDLPEVVDFNFHVKPILSDKCFACHGPDRANRSANLHIDTEEGARQILTNGGKAFVAKNWEKSHALQRILSDNPDQVMPPPEFNVTVSPREMAIIAKWIKQGAEYKNHWSFLPLEDPEIPELSNTEAIVINPIDNFVIKKLEQEGLSQSPQAKKETLLRRLSIDLTGLPPSIEDLDQFLSSNSPEAYENAVDQLLTSPHYGERLSYPVDGCSALR